MYIIVDFKAAIKKLPFVPEHRAIKLKAIVDCEVNGVERNAGEMWQIEGPTTYIPSPDVVCIHTIKCTSSCEFLRLLYWTS
jgi:hypothetical protein